MIHQPSPHTRAVLQAVFVTFLWSTSWVLIKFGLTTIPPLTFAGLRYSLAFLFLLPLALRSPHRATIRTLPRRTWLHLLILGILLYSVTQGAQFVGLAYLPATSVSLMLNFTGLIVALLGMALLAERPTRWQWLGCLIMLGGVVLYFYPINLPFDQMLGLGVVAVGVLANASAAVVGRQINREGAVPPLLVTTISMGIGAAALLGPALIMHDLPRITVGAWLLIVWLSLINTAFAFTLWNHTLRALSAMEASMINSTMLIQIALLAWLLLDETLSWRAVTGLVVVFCGVVVVQLRR